MGINKRKKEVLRLRKLRKKFAKQPNTIKKLNEEIKAQTAIITAHQQNQHNQNLWKITTLG